MVLNQENGRCKTTYGEYSKAWKYVRFFLLSIVTSVLFNLILMQRRLVSQLSWVLQINTNYNRNKYYPKEKYPITESGSTSSVISESVPMF